MSVDTSGGQLSIAGTSGDFVIPNEACILVDGGLTPLWFPNLLETEDTRVGFGDWVLNPAYWSPTPQRIDLWLMGHVNRDGDPYENLTEGFESNVNDWWVELLDPHDYIARLATLTMPSGGTRTTYIKKLALTGDPVARRPSGWPVTFEFLVPLAPFQTASV